MKRFAFLLTVGVVVLVACKNDDPPPPNNGVDDVYQACLIRNGWSKPDDTECQRCLAVSRAPRCGCPEFSEEYVGKCSDQGTAFGNERECDFTGDCVTKCGKDCGCMNNCYAGRDACRPKAAAVDGCTTDVCDKYCR